MINKISTMARRNLPMPIKTAVAKFHLKYFQPYLYKASLDYQYSDEKLKYVHLLEAINYVRVADLPHVYFEFGCHSARTFSASVRAAQHLGLNDAQFYAFDSFQGLPQVNIEEDGTFKTGEYNTSREEFIRVLKKQSGFNLPDENIIEGFYHESLTQALQNKMPKVGVVHIDVDLYASTVDVLKFISPLLVVGTVLLFDDWYCFPPGGNKGEVRAFNEFCKDNPAFSAQEWKNYSTFGKSFFVTSLP